MIRNSCFEVIITRVIIFLNKKFEKSIYFSYDIGYGSHVCISHCENFKDMLLYVVMHTDCTNARVNGESSYVFVCAIPDGNVLPMYCVNWSRGKS